MRSLRVGVVLVLFLGCRSADPTPTPPPTAGAGSPAPTPPVVRVEPVAEPTKPDLARRCDAVEWTGPGPTDHLPPGLRAIAEELVKRGQECIPEIEESLPLSVNLRRTAPDALYHWPSDRTRALLIRQLDDPDEQAAHHAAWALGLIGGPEVVQPLLDAGTRPGSKVREQVLFALRHGKLPSGSADRAYDLIIASLSDRGWWVRTPAAEALGDLSPAAKLDEAIALATKAAESEKDERVKSRLLQSIQALRAKK